MSGGGGVLILDPLIFYPEKGLFPQNITEEKMKSDVNDLRRVIRANSRLFGRLKG